MVVVVKGVMEYLRVKSVYDSWMTEVHTVDVLSLLP